LGASEWTAVGNYRGDHLKPESGPLLRALPLEFKSGIQAQSFIVFLYAKIRVSLIVEESEADFPLFVYCPCTLKQMSLCIGSASGEV
jgi:hypothetical protein